MALKDFYIGNTVNYNMVFTKQSDNTPLDISGMEIFVFFKEDLEDADSASILQKYFLLPNTSDTALGLATITLESSDTDNFTEPGKYFYGFKRIIPGSPPDVLTLEVGKVNVLRGGSSITTPHEYVPATALKSEADATTVITNAGFTVGNVTSEVSTTVLSGNTIRTNPGVGTYTDLSTPIDIILAT